MSDISSVGDATPPVSNPMLGGGIETTQSALTGTALVPAVKTPYVAREKPEPDPARKALVTRWQDDIKRARKRQEKPFKRMREDMDFAFGLQYPEQKDDDDRYMCNIVQRHIGQRVAALYARDPKCVARRKHRLEFEIWDGTEESLKLIQADLQRAQLTGQMPNPMTIQAMQDIQRGVQLRQMLDRVCETLEIVHSYARAQALPSFKRSMKQLVRRVETCGVGYVKLGYQRAMVMRPETSSRVADLSERIANIERIQADMEDGESDQDDADAESLRLEMKKLQSEPQVIVREGLVWDFPKSTKLLFDPKIIELSGFLGCDWIAEEYLMPCEMVQQIYNVDLGKNYTSYSADGKDMSSSWLRDGDRTKDLCCVYQIHDKTSTMVFTVAMGYGDFLEEPRDPEVKLARFFPYFPVTFNDIEHETQIFPPSDVRLLRHQQREYNRTMEARRQHRIANRPVYVSAAGVFEDADLKNLSSYNAHDVIELQGIQPGDKATDKLQPLGKIPIDPNVYEAETIMRDVERAVGTQEANLGGPVGNGSATGEGIAESSRMSSLASNADDLDDMLTELAKAETEVIFAEYDPDTVRAIAGVGAVWPQFASAEVADAVFLDVEAGSSGRPNKAQEMANFQRLAPFLLQVGGISPEWLAKYMIRIMDDRIDLTDAVVAGIPSIVAQNSALQPSTGLPASDPNQQGAEGGANRPAAPGAPPGGAPGFPAAQPPP